MNISYRWLQALAPSITDSPQEVADRLAMLGAPVDEVVDLGSEIRDIVIARVEDVRQHPNADRLRVCTVDAGSGATLQVVCGAPNVAAGGYYPFAPVGATLPGGLTIRKAKLRGEASEGMLCSARELGLGRDHMGLMALAGEWEVGALLVPSLGLDDTRLLVDITANRPDLLSHLGVAREIAPEGVEGATLPPFSSGKAAEVEIRATGHSGATEDARIEIEDEQGCPRYMGLVIRGIHVGPSPEWLATRLRAVGLRPINNVVDATNYVLLELGQPLHAFDLRKLGGGEVRIRRAASGETIRTLDGVERALDEKDLVIADAERPVAIAGVMGGEESEVSESTTEILLECALFDPRSVRRTARRLGLSTDASYRFERGVDPEGLPGALRRVADLILTVAGGEVAGEALDLNPILFEQRQVALRVERVEQVLGIAVGAEEIASLLRTIGFEVNGSGSPLRVAVPGFRPDIEREIDLIEEIARRRGYGSFPEELLPFRPSAVPEDPRTQAFQRLHELFGSWGFLEARTVGFAPPAEHRVPLLNPLSAEESHLRDALLPGLLRRVEHNWAHGVRDVRLYEIGTVFLPTGRGRAPDEEIRVAAAFTGARRPPHWSGEADTWDLWDLKALLEALGAVLGAASPTPGDYSPAASLAEVGERYRLVDSADHVLGGGGRAARAAIDAPAWAGPVWVLEARIPSDAGERPRLRYRPLPEHPAIERDAALIVPVAVTAAELDVTIDEAAGDLLESRYPFDLYTGAGIPVGTRSVAWRFRFRAPDRTLTDAEVDAVLQRILRTLEERLNVRRR